MLPAGATQEQTARAEAQNSDPDTAPQLRTMQSKAELRIMVDWKHWQAMSVGTQPKSSAADDKQENFKRRLARIG